MTRIMWVAVLIAALVAAGCSATPTATPAEKPTALGGGSMTRTMIIAHRGGAALAPENTLAAFERGIAEKADAVELDVHLSKDGAVVVMHDPILTRTTDGSGNIADLTLAELQKLNAAAKFTGGAIAPQKIPTLQEVVDLVNGRVGMQVEIKLKSDGSRYAGIEQKVVDILRKGDMIEKSVIISFNWLTLQDIKKIEPKLKTGALASAAYFKTVTSSAAVAQEVKAVGADYFGPEKSYLNAALLAELRKLGIGGGAWTVDDEAEMRKLAALNPDFLTTNRPDLLRKVLRP
jgi:glycerophosphoryl diester phosphodiesterase